MSAREFVPASGGLEAVRKAAAGCRGCQLHEHATQTVFGEGRRSASLMLVGEMAGDREDREGRPFVGPAGRELDRALEAAGIDRDEVYVTRPRLPLTRHRGELLESELAPAVAATIHPSAIVRDRDDASCAAQRQALADDLRMVAMSVKD